MKYILAFIGICSIGWTSAQNINWSSIDENQNHLLYLNFGYDFGVTTQVGYGHKLNWHLPVIFTADYSSPFGHALMDDFKTRIGAQIPVLGFNNFQFSVKLNSVYRKHQTKLVSANSIGSEIALLFGIYKPKWHLAAEFGYDNTGITHLQHTPEMSVIYPHIKNGWYASTAGNFFCGIQGSRTIGERFDFSLRLGAVKARLKDKNALVPIYFQIGVAYRF